MMTKYRKTCPGCNKRFIHLEDFIEHVKKAHKDIAPDELVKMGKEHKWQLKGSDT